MRIMGGIRLPIHLKLDPCPYECHWKNSGCTGRNNKALRNPIKAPIDRRSTVGTRHIIAGVFLAPLTDVWIYYIHRQYFNGSVNSRYFIFHTILRIVETKIRHIFTDKIEIAAYKNPIFHGSMFIVDFPILEYYCKGSSDLHNFVLLSSVTLFL